MPPERRARVLILMRHGETDWNRQGRVMGTEDVPLNDDGRAQCLRTADLLGRFGVDSIVSSPLARAVESAQLIAERLALEVAEDPDLVEVRFGGWQGLTYNEVLRDPHYARYYDNPATVPTPGGETLADVQTRGLAALGRDRVGRRTLFVSHGDIIRAMICHYLAIPLGKYRRVRVDNCGLTAVVIADGRTEYTHEHRPADDQRHNCPALHSVDLARGLQMSSRSATTHRRGNRSPPLLAGQSHCPQLRPFNAIILIVPLSPCLARH
jgi:broad specificity phosphatase PhoE